MVLALFRRLPEIRLTLNQDLVAAFEGDPAAKSIEEIVFSYPAVEAITAYRVAHELYRSEVPIIPRIISEYAHSRTGIDIHHARSRRALADAGDAVLGRGTRHPGTHWLATLCLATRPPANAVCGGARRPPQGAACARCCCGR